MNRFQIASILLCLATLDFAAATVIVILLDIRNILRKR